MRLTSLLALFALALACTAQAQAPADTLKKIADKRAISLGYRVDAAPFSFLGPDGMPAGFTVGLCKRVVAGLERQLKLTGLTINWVPVTAADRIERVTSGAIDLECGTTTVTHGRAQQVDFSSLVFVDGASFLSLAGGPTKLSQLAGLRVGVLPGSTTEERLRIVLKERMVDARVVALKDETDAINALTERRIDAFANDRIALVGRVLLAKPQGAQFSMAEEDFAIEPYALMMRRDADFRLAVNRALSQIYAGPVIGELYGEWFARLGKPSALLSALFVLNAFGE